MKSIALGVGGFFHDFNAGAIDLDTLEVSAAEEERFSRRKHHSILGADKSSIACIQHCLDSLNANFEDVRYLALSDEENHPIKSFICNLFPNAQVFHVNHHLSHAALAYYSSGADSAAIAVLDGFGDGMGGVLAIGEGSKITPLKWLPIEHSIGLEYLRVTYQLGLGSFGSEGKTQGLAPYGEPTLFEHYLNEIKLDKDGFWELSPQLQQMEAYLEGAHYIEEKSLFNDFLLNNMGRRFPNEPYTQENYNVARSIQEVLNYLALHATKTLRNSCSADTLVLSGGVALNSTMNGVLEESNLFTNVFAHPSASDRGNGLGAVLYALNNELSIPISFDKPIIYAGQSFSDKDIIRTLDAENIGYETVSCPSTVAAQLIASGNTVGWFQGKSELGARALGNRSILADPRKKEMKDTINEKIKHREWFRPFAPVCPDEYVSEYFETTSGAMPYMTMTTQVRLESRDKIPAVTHADGSARLQTLSKEFNAPYHKILTEFNKITDCPVVINTSFNDSGDAIVESPYDAVQCLRKTGLDYLVIGQQVIARNQI